MGVKGFGGGATNHEKLSVGLF